MEQPLLSLLYIVDNRSRSAAMTIEMSVGITRNDAWISSFSDDEYHQAVARNLAIEVMILNFFCLWWIRL